MKLVIFGLTISSSWGNGHATLWRGLCSALAKLGHSTTFYERDVDYYAGSRDWSSSAGIELVLYRDWWDAVKRARADLAVADVAIVTSYCPDALSAANEVADAGRPLAVFYDLDTPVTLEALRTGVEVPYIGERGLLDYELVLSYSGGAVLTELRAMLGARKVAPLYGHVDATVHCKRPAREHYRADLSYLGTYAPDRQRVLEELFLAPARARPAQRFVMAGAQYPDSFPWPSNLYFVRHLPPAEHGAFYSSSRLTLNVTRRAMAVNGWCPSGRLFEAAACGACIVTDAWPGLDEFYRPGTELIVAKSANDVLKALDMGDVELAFIAQAARERTLSEHTSQRRALELIALLEDARREVPVCGA